jgi:hypothetical protein
MYNQTQILYSMYTLDNEKMKFPLTVEISGMYKPENLNKAIEKINIILTSNPKFIEKFNGKTFEQLEYGIMVKRVDFRGTQITLQYTLGYPIKAKNDNREV